MSNRRVDRVIEYGAISYSLTQAGIIRMYHTAMHADPRQLTPTLLDELILCSEGRPTPEQLLREALRLWEYRLEGQYPVGPR